MSESPAERLRVLYDGWALVYEPNSPGALHLLTLLENLPAEVEPHLALPGEPPDWTPGAEQGVTRHINPTPADNRAHLAWEQRSLPQLSDQLGARLLHLVSAAPLFGRTPTVLSPTGYSPETPVPAASGLAGRLRLAMGAGGAARLRVRLWPEDLPDDQNKPPIRRLPALVNRVFTPPEGPGKTGPAPGLDQFQIPETYILYHGPYDEGQLNRLLAAWRWAAGPIGDHYPLLILGLPEAARQRLENLAAGLQLAETLLCLPVVPPAALGELYRNCTALFHPAPVSPWGEPLRAALACGKPIVALETPFSAAITGPAAYLAPESQSRALGAALITTVIEESVAEALSAGAIQRAAAWRSTAFPTELAQAYLQAIGE